VCEFDDGEVEEAHELADLVYVCYWHAHARGIPLDAVVAEIHNANLTKLGDDGQPVRDPDTGKVLKGKNYRRPNVRAVLEAS
jgi:predicted HAD superfamily Cof-like phosphohydrolase